MFDCRGFTNIFILAYENMFFPKNCCLIVEKPTLQLSLSIFIFFPHCKLLFDGWESHFPTLSISCFFPLAYDVSVLLSPPPLLLCFFLHEMCLLLQPNKPYIFQNLLQAGSLVELRLWLWWFGWVVDLWYVVCLWFYGFLKIRIFICWL